MVTKDLCRQSLYIDSNSQLSLKLFLWTFFYWKKSSENQICILTIFIWATLSHSASSSRIIRLSRDSLLNVLTRLEITNRCSNSFRLISSSSGFRGNPYEHVQKVTQTIGTELEYKYLLNEMVKQLRMKYSFKVQAENKLLKLNTCTCLVYITFI